MPIDETKNKRLVIVVSQETAKTIEQLAKKDRRPVSAYVRNVLEDHCQAAAMRGEAERHGGGAGIFTVCGQPLLLMSDASSLRASMFC